MLHDNNGSSNGHAVNGNGQNRDSDRNIIHFPARENKPSGPSVPPMINLPPVTKILLGLIIGIHALVWLSDFQPGLQDTIYTHGAFIPASWSGTSPFLWWTPLTIITFSFLHGGWLHLGMNALMLMAFGSGIERWLGARRMLIVFAGSTLLALLCQFAVSPHSYSGVVGISGGISGFFGALLLMMQQQQALGNARNSTLPFIVIWVVMTVGFGLAGAPDGTPIAWLAHLGGFFGGLSIAWVLIGRPKLFLRR